MDWLHQRKYLVLLIVLVPLAVIYPLLHDSLAGLLLLNVLISVLILASFLMVFTGRYTRLLAVLFGVPALIGNWVGHTIPELPRAPLVVLFYTLSALFLGLVVVVILV